LKKYVQTELEKKQSKKIDFQIILDAAIASKKIAAEEKIETPDDNENLEYSEYYLFFSFFLKKNKE
jgi:hypothetical protein